MRLSWISTTASAALLLSLSVVGAVRATPPEYRSHSHNDYLQAEPLATALTHRMGSVEADVWLIDGELRVGHTREETHPGRTLRSLYLEPLRRHCDRSGADARVYAGGPPLMLLVDVKSDADPTCAAVERELEAYASLFTQFDEPEVKPGAVTVVLSGNVSRLRLSRAGPRLAACDGRPSDLLQNPPLSAVPLISDNWTKHFRWNGEGTMPAGERAALRRLAERCHAQGRKLRLWAAPDTEASWREQFAAGIDYINTDRPAALHAFLTTAAGVSSANAAASRGSR